jgi:hypothetical protein
MGKTPAVKSKVIVLTAVILLLCAAWTMALNTGLAGAGSRVVTRVKNTAYAVPEPVYVDVEKPVTEVRTVEVDRPVYITREVDVPRDVPVALKDWNSPEDLADFLKNDDTDQHIFLRADDSGGVALNGQCEDLALQLRDRAMAIGRYLSVQVLSPQEYLKWYGVALRSNVYHAICMARIGNGFWYIEPSTDKYWLALNLD